MGGKLKSQIHHTLTGMATKLPIANKIVLGSNCGDGASREWETNSNASAAGINLTNEDCKITDSVSSIERNIVGNNLVPMEKQDCSVKPPRPPIAKMSVPIKNDISSDVNEISELSDPVDDPILGVEGLSTFKIPPRFIAGLDDIVADEDDSVCDDNTVNISNIFRSRPTTVSDVITNGYGDVVAQVNTGAEVTVTNFSWVLHDPIWYKE